MSTWQRHWPPLIRSVGAVGMRAHWALQGRGHSGAGWLYGLWVTYDTRSHEGTQSRLQYATIPANLASQAEI